jgi:hypothetical protein
MRNKISKIEKIMIDLGKKLNCKELYVTNGSAGIISWSKKEGIIFSPTFVLFGTPLWISWFFDGIMSSGAVWAINAIVEWFEENRPKQD